MATSALQRRLGKIAVFAVLTVALLGVWLLRPSDGERNLSSISIASGPRPSVKLRQGTHVGKEFEGNFPQALEQWLGIPYGQSTAGERRFQPPLPVNASKGAFDAVDYGHRCPSGTPNDVPMSEDCLNLNIYRPKRRPKGEKLPVLVHIYGGAFNFGAGNSRQVSNMVAWSEEPFIGVSFNYRVGAFGFLPSSLTAKEGLLNAGLKDQALLLEWVQENIAEFGGDPDDVTLMGNSAGAHSVCYSTIPSPCN
jgi:acetylcholinesterase